MNFTGILDLIKLNPGIDLKETYDQIKIKLGDLESEKQGGFVAENNIDRSLSLNQWTESHRDKFLRILVDSYSDLINNMNTEINNIIGDSDNEYDRKICELFKDISNEKIEDILYEQRDSETFIKYYLYREPTNLSNDKYIYYPSIYNAVNFIPELLKKKEFYENQNKSPSKTKNKNNSFRKSSSQKFVKNYISEDTPYNGILMWHEVGVGKTCGAIGIAENFKNIIDDPHKKIIVLTPGKTLTESWYDEIFNIKKELKYSKNNYNQQCTGNSYTKLKIINHKKQESYARIKRRRDKIINEYYSILGYRTFVNKFDKDFIKYITNNIDKGDEKYYYRNLIKFIEDRFSNRVFLLDEIQYTREDNSSSKDALEGKKIRKCLELIVRYAKNIKLVLLSATPMYDKASEIIWLINLLRLNDKRAPLRLEDYFENNTLIKTDNIPARFLNNIRGYISYQRGEDPFVFPTKLYPSIDNSDWKNLYIPNTPECLVRSGIYDLSELDEKKRRIVIKDNPEVKHLTLYQSFMDKWQYKYYNRFIKTKSRGYDIKPRQYSNIIFPNISEDGELLSSPWADDSNNYNKLFIKEGPKYRIHDALITDNKSILNIDRIGKYSRKMENILNIIKETEGIIFIYSQFITYGAQTLAFCLEENGYNRFNCNSNGTILENQNFIKNPTGTEKSNKNYILLTGKTRKNILNKLKDYTNSPNNKNGKNIKVIIGTSVVEQGISFFNVRQIHIMDPWYNINSLNQIIGRGVRRFSHHMLSERKRNVTVYLHCAVMPNIVSISKKKKKVRKILQDEHLYSISLMKYSQVLEIQRLMKTGAVDCNLNKKGNIFLELEQPDIYSIDSRGNNRGSIPLNDLDNSIRCDLDTCDYKCDHPVNLSNVLVGTDTYNTKISDEKILIYIEEIKNIFSKNFGIELSNLKKKLNISLSLQDNEDERESLILEALRTLIENKVNIYNTVIHKNGFIVLNTDKNKNYYIFQESNNNNELIKDKYLPVKNINKDFYIDDITTSNDDNNAAPSSGGNKTINNLVDLLVLSIYNCIIHYWEDAAVMINAQGGNKDMIYQQFKDVSGNTKCEDVKFSEELSEVDTENNGTISRADLQSLLIKHKYVITAPEFNSLVNKNISKTDDDLVNYSGFIKNLKKKPCHLNLKDDTDIYHKKDLLEFSINDPENLPNLETIILERKKLLFRNTYAFNNFKTTLFEKSKYEADTKKKKTDISEYFHMATVDKPKSGATITLTYEKEKERVAAEKKTLPVPIHKCSITNTSVDSINYELNRFYDGVYHKNLPNIYDIIYNQFLTYLEDKPIEMRNEDLKNIFKKIRSDGKPIKEYLDSFFIYKNSNKPHSEQKPFRIDFKNINNKSIMEEQVLKIILYSYFSSRNLNIPFKDGDSDDKIILKETHPYRKFSYFLTDKMFQIAKSYKIPTKGQPPNYNPKNIVVNGEDKIMYLIIPVSSVKKSKKKGRTGKDGFLLWDIVGVKDSPNSIFTKDKNYFNSFFPMSDNYFGFYNSSVFGFTLFSSVKKKKKLSSKSFYVVNSDPAIDPSYEKKYTDSGKISKKSLRRGAACGHGLGVMTKTNLGKLINAMIYKLTGNILKYQKYGEIGKWKQIPYSPDLCMELKVILRKLDSLGYIDNSEVPREPLNLSTRYFYHEHIKTKIDRTIESIDL